MVSDTTPHNFQSGGTPGGASTAEDKADLETQIDHLRKDLAGVTDSLKSLASNQADDARRNVFALRDDVRERGERYIQQAQDAASDLEEQLSERVRAEPIKSVLIAAAAGYLYARIFRR